MHFQMSQPYLNSTLHIHIVSLYKLSLFHPELPLSPQSPPLYFSLYLTFFVPLFLFFLSPDVCSPAVLRWLRRADRMGLYGVCTHSNAQTDMHTNIHAECQRVTCYSRDPGHLSRSPKISVCFHFSHIYSLCMTTSI